MAGETPLQDPPQKKYKKRPRTQPTKPRRRLAGDSSERCGCDGKEGFKDDDCARFLLGFSNLSSHTRTAMERPSEPMLSVRQAEALGELLWTPLNIHNRAGASALSTPPLELVRRVARGLKAHLGLPVADLDREDGGGGPGLELLSVKLEGSAAAHVRAPQTPELCASARCTVPPCAPARVYSVCSS